MQDQVASIIDECRQDDRRLISELSLLARTHGDDVYREALLLLVGKDFASALARRYWEEALAHRERILVGDRIDSTLRPALLDYLHQVVQELSDPRIVEATDLASIRNASISDGLTGLYNQTYFKAFVDKLCRQRSPRTSASCAILLLDLDHFKQYNDRCGHLPGDRALRRTAEILQNCIRKGDVAARYGGEEFAIFLSQIGRDQAYKVANRIRQAIEDECFPGQHLLDRGNLTISGGLAFLSGQNEKPEDLIQQADQELYRAKLFRNVVSPHMHENRKSARMQRQSIVEIALPGESSFSPAMSYDVSPYGIALDCDRRLEAGMSVKLRFRHPFWPSNRQVVATIRHVEEQHGTGLYRLGLKFNPEQALSRSENVLKDSA